MQKAREVADILTAIDCAVSIIDTDALREQVDKEAVANDGWDASDALAKCDAAEIRKTAHSFAKLYAPPPRRGNGEGGHAEPLPLVPPIPPARPYPVEALGEVLSGATESIAAKCQCSPTLAAQAVLAVASLAAQRLADIRLPFRQTRPLSLYFVTIAASGDRKSTADNEALIPVRTYEKNLKREYETGLLPVSWTPRKGDC